MLQTKYAQPSVSHAVDTTRWREINSTNWLFRKKKGQSKGGRILKRVLGQKKSLLRDPIPRESTAGFMDQMHRASTYWSISLTRKVRLNHTLWWMTANNKFKNHQSTSLAKKRLKARTKRAVAQAQISLQSTKNRRSHNVLLNNKSNQVLMVRWEFVDQPIWNKPDRISATELSNSDRALYL